MICGLLANARAGLAEAIGRLQEIKYVKVRILEEFLCQMEKSKIERALGA